MKLSIIIAILDSHQIVNLQIKHFKKMNLPNNVEIIFMDDGSDPSLKSKCKNYNLRNFNIYPTGDTRPWSQACARNLGAKIAEGEYLLMTDIDHILTKELIMSALTFSGSKMIFKREFGVLDKRGYLTQNLKILNHYGLQKSNNKRRHMRTNTHTNSFVIKKSIYKAIKGYPPRVCNRPLKGNKGDAYLFKRFKKYVHAGNCAGAVRGPYPIYTYPGLPEDKFDLFHNLTRGSKEPKCLLTRQ